MSTLLLAAVIATSGVIGGPHGTGGAGVQIEPWQVINLIGAPLLALLFLQPVIEDVRAWLKKG